MKASSFVPLLFILATTFFSCKEDEPGLPEEITYIYLDKSIQSQAYKAGSYWIFQNDSTGDLDSVIVTSTDSGFGPKSYVFFGPEIRPSRFQYFKANFKSFYDSTTWQDYMRENIITRIPEGASYGQAIFSGGLPIGYKLGALEMLDSLATYSVNGHQFNQVCKLKMTAALQDQPLFSHDAYLYYADEVGFFKTEMPIGSYAESWSLLRWHVVK